MCAEMSSPLPRRVAVTGASGFVGGHLVRRLRAHSVEVHAYGRRPAASVRADVADVYESWDITRAPLAAPPNVDAVVHCAGAVSDWGSRAFFEAGNVTGTRNVLATWPGARIVHVSSASVYDPRHGKAVLEEADAPVHSVREIERVRWMNEYGRTKRLAEHVVSTEAASWAILRPHIVYGPCDTTVAPRLAGLVRRGTLLLPGDGRNVRASVVHVDNLCHGIECALRTERSGVWNIVDAVAPTVHEATSSLFDALGMDVTIRYLPVMPVYALSAVLERVWRLARARQAPRITRYAVAHIAHDNVLSIERARQELGYAPTLAWPESFETISLA